MVPEYPYLLETIAGQGEKVAPRGQATRERRNVSVSFQPGEVVARKGASIPLMFAEMLQVLGGYFNLDEIKMAAPKAAHGLFTEPMAYGSRLNAHDQMQRAIDAPKADPASREAYVHLGRPEDRMVGGQIPCMQSVQFLIRGGRLETVATFRSWDVVVGLPVNVVILGGLALAVAAVLKVKPGRATIQAASAHIYETSIEAGKLDAARPWGVFQLPVFIWQQATEWQDVRQWAAVEFGDHWLHGYPESKWPPCLVVKKEES